MDKKVSVIMGIYNCADTLPEAVDSILNQTYREWELILCDDGSSDDTYMVAKRYAEQYDNIFLYQNERNMGLNYTLNRCLEKATGEYIARMDGDDISLPMRFGKELEFLERNPQYAVVSTPMIYFDENGEWARGSASGAPDPSRLIYGTVHCHAPCMIRAEVIRDLGGYTVSKRLLRVEDWHLWLKLYASGQRGYNLSEPLYKMRDDRNASSRRKYRYRINEAYVVTLAVKAFDLPKMKYICALRPLIVGLMPRPIYDYVHRRKLKH